MRRFCKRLLCTLLAALTLALPLTAALAATPDAVNMNAQNLISVLYKYSDSESGRDYIVCAPGFPIGVEGQEAYQFMTHGYIIQVAGTGDGALFVETSSGVFEAEASYFDETSRLLIVTTDGAVENIYPMTLADTQDLSIGDSVYACGLTQYDYNSNAEFMYTENTISVISSDEHVIGYDADEPPVSMCGGPVFAGDGSVAGVCCGYSTDDQVGIAADPDMIRSVMDAAGVQYGSSGSSGGNSGGITEDGSSGSSGGESGGNSGGITDGGSSGSSDGSSGGSSGGKSNNTVLIIVIAAVVLGAVYIFTRRKKDGAKTAVTDRSLLCAGGPFAGQTFPVGSGFVIGRDPGRCAIVYPQDTPGISSAHCSVSVSNGQVILSDLGSTYGTFLSNGVKLQQGQSVALNAGESFYLAAPVNTFTVV